MPGMFRRAIFGALLAGVLLTSGCGLEENPEPVAATATPAPAIPCKTACRDLTVDRSDPLPLPGLDVRVVKIQTGAVVIPPRNEGLVRRADGRFVLVVVRMRNTGDRPVHALPVARLRLGERTFEPSVTATATVTPVDAFPLAPGATGVAAVVFDVHVALADEAVRDGTLEFPGGRIRLRQQA